MDWLIVSALIIFVIVVIYMLVKNNQKNSNFMMQYPFPYYCWADPSGYCVSPPSEDGCKGNPYSQTGVTRKCIQILPQLINPR